MSDIVDELTFKRMGFFLYSVCISATDPKCLPEVIRELATVQTADRTTMIEMFSDLQMRLECYLKIYNTNPRLRLKHGGDVPYTDHLMFYPNEGPKKKVKSESDEPDK